MDELPVLGHVGEFVDPVLIDEDPVGDADLGPDLRLYLFKAGQRH